ncbi:MAG: peptidoglycan-binding protein [Alphaproteobacteria bacterium]
MHLHKPACAALAAALSLAAAPALASDGPPSQTQDVQIAQSTLSLLGYYDGSLDGDFDQATRAALERALLDTHYAGAFDSLDAPVMGFLASLAGPALAEAFGTDPTGTWDVDLSGLSADERRALLDLHQWESLALCASPLAMHIQGMALGTWLYGFTGALTLADGALTPLPDPERPDHPQPGFTFVDVDTMQRVVDGAIETWHRCK